MSEVFTRYREAQQDIARGVLDGLTNTMGGLDFTRIDASAPAWVAASTAVVQRGYQEAVTAGSDFLTDFANAGAIPKRFQLKPATLDSKLVVTSLVTLGLYRAKHLMAQGYDIDRAIREVFAAVSGAGMRHAMAGMRETVTNTSKTYTRVRRIAKEGCCGFCAMLATRDYWIPSDQEPATSAAAVVVGRNGRTRGPQSISAQYHDNCKCEVVPVSDELQPEGYDERLEKFEDAYYEARRRAEDREGGAAVGKNVIREMDKLHREGWF
jgi:hypothetical protein